MNNYKYKIELHLNNISVTLLQYSFSDSEKWWKYQLL